MTDGLTPELRTKFAEADRRLRERKARIKDQRRQERNAKLNTQRCGAMTKKGTPCARRAWGNGRCPSHGGKDRAVDPNTGLPPRHSC